MAENEKLETRAKASEQGKMKNKLERAKLESDLHNVKRLLDRIPADILEQARRKQNPHQRQPALRAIVP
ncbi:hypothetical protein [Caldifermentibacillus hisashii]|uniref:hypothetical protein n=1 Tax=Caldifermentibacillus hisashii TaxID=996558 RepID=UPI003CCE6BAF